MSNTENGSVLRKLRNLPNNSSWSPLIALVCLMLCGQPSAAQTVKPGLVATYTDGRESVARVVASPNFSLRLGESIHPQIDRSFTAAWDGVLKIDRAGRYRIYAQGAHVELKGQAAGKWGKLATGEHPIRIQYERPTGKGDTRIELRWESEFFRDEPLPVAALAHVKTTAQVASQDIVEQGRYLFAELGCANCHSAGDWNLQSRRGPNLSNVGSRIRPEWIFHWLKSPHQYRASAVMPVCLENDRDRADVTAYLASLRSASEVRVAEDIRGEQVETGRLIFEQVGCAKCHDKDNNLDAVGSKYVSVTSLEDFIANPHAIDPHGRMPQLFKLADERHMARAVASFLFRERRRAEPYSAAPQGNVQRGAQLFAANGCAGCHKATVSTGGGDVLKGPAFGHPAGLPLRHYWDFGRDQTAEVTDRISGKREAVTGRSSLPAGAHPNRGFAFDFDGKTFIELQHFHRPDVMTISVWVKTSHGGSILTWGRPGGGQRGSRELRMNIGQDGKNSVCYGEYNSDGGWRPVTVRPTTVNLIDGRWHHIAVVRKGQSIQHYVDGKPEGGGGRVHSGSGDYTDRLLIGALGLQRNASNYFKGLMDDLAIWDTALSAGQIAALAEGQSPLDLAKPTQREIKPFDVDAGCLASAVKRSLPDYRLKQSDRTALRRFLKTVQPKENVVKYQIAPLTTRDLRIRQFRCTACHELNDQNIQTGSQVDDKGRIIRVERPPRLTGAGTRLTSSWLREVLLEEKRNRPWLKLRMPHFGSGAGDLPQLIVRCSGVSSEDTDARPDRSHAQAGLAMIGQRRGQVSCINCHDYRGINRRKDGVVPAPDIADAARTVPREWFYRWMYDPSRLQPGTSMPQMFLDVSPQERELRISQLWSALVYQDQLPLPKGVLDQQTEGTRIVVKDAPVIFRMATITPVGQLDRAVNVGVPGGFNFTFDAASCRLRYVWKGPFLDAGPAWNGRGGNPVRAGSDKLAAIKLGHAVRIGRSSDPKVLRFLGYRLVEGMPVFRYAVDGVVVEHRIGVSQSAIVQSIVVRNPSRDVFYVGDSENRFTSATGKRDGDVIRFPKADVVKFKIEMPVNGSPSQQP